MKALQRVVLLPLIAFSSAFAPQNERKEAIEHPTSFLNYTRTLGQKQGEVCSPCTPSVSHRQEAVSGAQTFLLQTFCRVSNPDMVGVKSSTLSGHLVIMHHSVISSFAKWDYVCLPAWRLITFRGHAVMGLLLVTRSLGLLDQC